jgi:hypothetical protein
MTDPMDALRGLQAALDSGAVRLRACELHSAMRVLLDHPNGNPRFTYAQMSGNKVQAVTLFAHSRYRAYPASRSVGPSLNP